MARKKAKPFDEAAFITELIERIIRECPRRQPTSEDERRAQAIMEEELGKIGLSTTEEPFLFNDNLYANIALHFGLGTLGTVVSGVAPLAGFLLHSLAGGSYWADSTRRAYILRRLFRFKPARNLLATLPADREEPDLRVVFLAHADAGFTGLLFEPSTIHRFSGDLPPELDFVKRPMALVTKTQFALAGLDLLRLALGPLALPLRPLEAVLTVPALIAFGLNMQIVLRNEVVPGANDDLSGVAALPVLARRLAPTKPPGVEYVFGVTGCEEASLGGGDALARAKEGVWDRKRTVIVGLDGLTNGELTFLRTEGEVSPLRIPAWLDETCREVAASEPRFNGVKGFDVPVGGSDIQAFLAHGWEGVCLACVDPSIGAPRHYHVPSDTPENLETEQLLHSIDFAEKLTRVILEGRLGSAGSSTGRNKI